MNEYKFNGGTRASYGGGGRGDTEAALPFTAPCHPRPLYLEEGSGPGGKIAASPHFSKGASFVHLGRWKRYKHQTSDEQLQPPPNSIPVLTPKSTPKAEPLSSPTWLYRNIVPTRLKSRSLPLPFPSVFDPVPQAPGTSWPSCPRRQGANPPRCGLSSDCARCPGGGCRRGLYSQPSPLFSRVDHQAFGAAGPPSHRGFQSLSELPLT